MFNIYFFNAEGKYHQPVSIEYLEVAVEIATKYRFIAPKIMITNDMDASVLEFQAGRLIHPEEDSDLIDELESLEELEFNGEDYEYKIHLLDEEEAYTDEWNDLIASLFAVAARDNVNLRALGWEPL